MSALLRPGTSGYFRDVTNQNDDSIQPADYRVSMPQMTGTGNLLRFTDVLWTRSRFPMQFPNGFNGLENAPRYWEWNWPPTGTRVRKTFTGIVEDRNGTPVPNATVKLFNAATGTLVDTQTTASDGRYRCGDPNNVACFAVGYLTGSPDTAGTTINTLTGS